MKSENETIKDSATKDISTLFELEGDDYKPERVGLFWSNNYIEYESKNGGNKNLLVKEYLNKVKLYFRHIIIDLQKSGQWRCRWRAWNALIEQQYRL